MKIDVEIEGLDALRVRLEKMQAATQNLQPGLLRAGVVATTAAKDRIDAGGPGWPPNATETSLLHRTGRLLASLTAGASGSVSSLSSDTIEVGTNVRYARWLQEGTGIYGPSGEPIRPKNGKVLSFMLGNRRVFAKSVKGTPPRPYLFIDEKVAEAIRDVFAEHVMGGENA